jgi:hypothetical protein
VVNFPGRPEWVGRFVDVVIRRAGPFSVWGEVTTERADATKAMGKPVVGATVER